MAEQIRDERNAGANTALRVGSLLLAMIDALSDKSELDDMFIHKDKPDSTDYLLSLFGGAKIGKGLTFGDFFTGVKGGLIDEDARAELEALVLRSSHR